MGRPGRAGSRSSSCSARPCCWPSCPRSSSARSSRSSRRSACRRSSSAWSSSRRSATSPSTSSPSSWRPRTRWSSRWPCRFGSSLQVALFVGPVLVLLGLVVGQPMDLVFAPLEVAAVGAAVGISALIALDGESNWLEGALLMLVYIILAVSFFEFSARSVARRAGADGGAGGEPPPVRTRRGDRSRIRPRRPPASSSSARSRQRRRTRRGRQPSAAVRASSEPAPAWASRPSPPTRPRSPSCAGPTASRRGWRRSRSSSGARAAVVVPGPGLDPALDRDLLALAEELAAGLGQAVPGHDVVVLGLLLAWPMYSLVATVNCVTALPLAGCASPGRA